MIWHRTICLRKDKRKIDLMAHPAMAALHTKRRLVEFFGGPLGAAYGTALAEIARGRVPDEFMPGAVRETKGTFGTDLAKRLAFSATYWTDRDMVDLVAHAATSRPLSPITIEDAPTQHGFVLFDMPAYIYFAEESGEYTILNIKAFMWNQSVSMSGEPGFQVVFWSDPHDRQDSLNGVLRANKVDPFASTGGLAVAQVAFIPFRRDFYDHLWWSAFASTFWHLLAQPVVVTTPTEPDRQTRKVLQRSQVQANTVSIITLRRMKQALPDGAEPVVRSGSTLKVRFLVGEKTGGFWRNHWYPSLGMHKPIFVMPYMKGPDGAPFVWRNEKIYAWRR